MATQKQRYGAGKRKRYIVDTKIEPDAVQTQHVSYVTGLKAACGRAREDAYSQQTRSVVKDLRTGREIGAYRFARGREDVVGRGRCK